MIALLHSPTAPPGAVHPAVDHGGKTEALITYLLAASLAIAGITALNERMQVAPIPPPPTWLPQPVAQGDQISLRVPGYRLCTDAASYSDEYFAYLMFDYLRYPFRKSGLQLMLVFHEAEANARYRLVACGGQDMLAGIASVAGATISGVALPDRWSMTAERQVAGMSQQSAVFDGAYNLPVRQKLEQLPENALARYLQRFIRFKSATDPRIRRRIEPVPAALSSREAQSLAADIITVARFYDLPLDFFLGIGAMENNYMNVRGDLRHTIWKRYPAPDDIVVERKRGRVRVVNDSAGVWQITRETLRYAHRLYLRDDRDYSGLPEHLRPPETLAVAEVDPDVLTTYAGLLLRNLLDRFEGDVTLAVSAYNGGPARPNLRYGRGVEAAAQHARRALEQAAVLNGESVMRRQWLR